eukprot:TRINITY_DN7249_c0_g1_i1.p1 TRINITY_DN7249_c0_g1~~TRINITY_DN7249_c0_g1_i1.p1  ORF type:complete len:2507 (+),score=519.55 TRINITY_DN7249_c0_g1_i1:98-7618(+)
MQGAKRHPNPEDRLDKRTRGILLDLFSRLTKEDTLIERLRQVVLDHARGANGEQFGTLVEVIVARTKALIVLNKPEDLHAALSVLEMMMSLDDPRTVSQSSLQWKNILQLALKNSRTHGPMVMHKVAVTLGHFVSRFPGTLTKQLVAFEISNALEGMEKDKSILKESGILVFSELVRQVPYLVKSQDVDVFLQVMWGPLMEQNVLIQTATLDVLRWCLNYISERKAQLLPKFKTIFFSLCTNIEKKQTPDLVLGSLLVLSEWLRYGGEMMKPKEILTRVTLPVFALKDHKSSAIKQTVIKLIPQLVKVDHKLFSELYLKDILSYLNDCLRKERMTHLVLGVNGELAMELRDKNLSFVAVTLDYINNFLQVRIRKKAIPVPPEMFKCIGLFAKAFGSQLSSKIKIILRNLSIIDFSQVFVESMHEIIEGIPELSESVESLIMLLVATTLTGRDTLTNGPPQGPSTQFAFEFNNLFDLLSTAPPPLDDAQIPSLLLALGILGSWHFKFRDTLVIAKYISRHYIFATNPKLRKAAVEACAKLLQKKESIVGKSLRSYAASLVTEILESLFDVALTDTELDIRATVLCSLDTSCLSRFLSQTVFLDTLFMFMRDESVVVQEAALSRIGELAVVNPGYIYPQLRTILANNIRALTIVTTPTTTTSNTSSPSLLTLVAPMTQEKLQTQSPATPHSVSTNMILSEDSEQQELEKQRQRIQSELQHKENSCRLLVVICRHFPNIVVSYDKALIQVLSDILKEPNSLLSSYALQALTFMAREAGQKFLKRSGELVPLILDNFLSPTTTTQLTVVTDMLVELVVRTGYEVDLLVHCPKLLDIVLQRIGAERDASLRGNLLRLLGTIGAIDPYRYKVLQLELIEKENENKKKKEQKDGTALRIREKDSFFKETMRILTPNSEEYYPTVALELLMKLLEDTSSIEKIQMVQVVQDLMTILKSMGVSCVQYLKHFLPPLVNLMELYGDNTPGLCEIIFQQLGVLVLILKHYAKQYVDTFMKLMLDYWGYPNLVDKILVLMRNMFHVLGDEFGGYLRKILPSLVVVLKEEGSNSCQVLQALNFFGVTLEEHLYYVVPAVLHLCTPKDMNKQELITEALHTLVHLSNVHDLQSQILQIFRQLNQVLRNPNKGLQEIAMDTVCHFIQTMSSHPKIEVLTNMIHRTVQSEGIEHANFTKLYEALMADKRHTLFNQTSKDVSLPLVSTKRNTMEQDLQMESSDFKTHRMQSERFIAAWDISGVFLKSDWYEWMSRVSITMLRESPATALRIMTGLAMVHPTVAQNLFSVSFMSCWDQLKEKEKEQVVVFIHRALSSSKITAKVLHRLLDLTEFMERAEKPLPLDNNILGELAHRAGAYAKALYYFEKEFKESPQPHLEQFHNLITVNDKLGQHEAGNGLLKKAKAIPSVGTVNIPIAWYEKIQNWSEVLSVYNANQEREPTNLLIMLDRMRCLFHLGEWRQLSVLASRAQTLNSESDTELKNMITLFQLKACLNLGKLDALRTHISNLDEKSFDSSFFQAVTCIHEGNYASAQTAIDKARGIAAGQLTTLVGESYNRAYDVIVSVQQLRELEEIIEFLQKPVISSGLECTGLYASQNITNHVAGSVSSTSPENHMLRRETFKNLWYTRLREVRRDTETWKNILSTHALISSPKLSPHLWLKFSNLMRKKKDFARASKLLETLLVDEDESESGSIHETGSSDTLHEGRTPKIIPIPTKGDGRVYYSYLNLLWDEGGERKMVAFKQMSSWITRFKIYNNNPYNEHEKEKETDDDLSAGGRAESDYVSKSLQARCYAKLAHWYLELHEQDLDESHIPIMIETSKQALEYDPNWHKSWRTWAITNYTALQYYSKKSENHPKIAMHHLPAVSGFIRSIALSPRENLQDTLRLLTLWFGYGYSKEIDTAIRESFKTLNIDTWLSVLPQLIARIHVSHVRTGVNQLLSKLGEKHPQALVFPITVALKDPMRTRVTAAHAIMNELKQHSSKLLQEAAFVSKELIEISVLWREKWCKGLEEASQAYYIDKKVDKMMGILLPLHDMVNLPARTAHEKAFIQAFGKDLDKAWSCCRDFLKTRNEASLTLAWEIYSHLFRIIKRYLQNDFDKLYLSQVSPDLEAVNHSELTVPGTYLKCFKAKKPLTFIKKFVPMLKVIPSKQQPRKLVILGTDGNDYPFLLKGHEDLRQDERVMQLFGLVNNFLENHEITSKKHLEIQQYSAIPLSSDSGLLEWLPSSDTIHELLKFYRHSHQIPLEEELNSMQMMAAKEEFYKLPIAHKLEVFEFALFRSPGNDLERILWLNSQNSELWLDKRTTYTSSLAVMSMVGYILGLGDRHPNNLMLNRNSGKVIHIDFGDCFEVAMLRDKFAEKVPFRLTRMLIQAMEVSGTEGLFRATCERVMGVLREHKESIMAVLEAFLYDPLINWKIRGPNKFNVEEGLADEGNSFDNYGQPDVSVSPNEKALTVLKRISSKLSGTEFSRLGQVETERQVDILIDQATSYSNLCQHYLGWCPYW